MSSAFTSLVSPSLRRVETTQPGAMRGGEGTGVKDPRPSGASVCPKAERKPQTAETPPTDGESRIRTPPTRQLKPTHPAPPSPSVLARFERQSEYPFLPDLPTTFQTRSTDKTPTLSLYRTTPLPPRDTSAKWGSDSIPSAT
ncbi:hypothetical protein V502_05913 [Pseudogymnoascus sp. VKM F-4520 (FW-2644)]|nr:hypothetical protein V502_05913 [Pseudogymnoascus sp. VKM F-4520 (FW-2644)]